MLHARRDDPGQDRKPILPRQNKLKMNTVQADQNACTEELGSFVEKYFGGMCCCLEESMRTLAVRSEPKVTIQAHGRSWVGRAKPT